MNRIRFCDRVFSPSAHHQTIVHSRGGSRTAPAVGPFIIRHYAITVLLLNLTARFIIVGGKKK
ncbi:hypothetical protein VU06_03290 [Desulfobulbus sp. F3]|nr:hypothetical protein [Desulfobulbus sp. F3]